MVALHDHRLTSSDRCRTGNRTVSGSLGSGMSTGSLPRAWFSPVITRSADSTATVVEE